jgi:hypothetical protein
MRFEIVPQANPRTPKEVDMFDREVSSVKASPLRLGLCYLLMALTCALVLIVTAVGKANAQSTPAPSAPGVTAASKAPGTPQASASSPADAINSFTGTDANLSPQRLQALVGRIALYPDDLLGLVLTASTQPLEIVEAQRFLETRKTDPAAKFPKTWDPSVIALLNYPDVVKLMDADVTWTEQLGTSVINQRAAVLDAIQGFRRKAYSAGNLRSNDRETVTASSDGAAQDQGQDGTIAISPAGPQVIYVPSYDPAAVVAPAPSYDGSAYEWSPAYPYYGDPNASFFPGIWYGGIIGFAFDWHDHQIFRGDDHRDHDRDGHRDHDHEHGGVGWEGDGHPRLAPGIAIHGRSIWEPDHGAVRQAQAGFTARDPVGIRPAVAVSGFAHSLPSTVARPMPQVVHGGAGISSPSPVQAFRGTRAIRNGVAMPPHSFAGSGIAGPHFAGAHVVAPMNAPRAGMIASPIPGGVGGGVHGGAGGGMAEGGFHGDGSHR